MKIVSCIKQVYDLDIVLENDWVVDKTNNTVDIHYAKRIMNSFDETALEMMLHLQDINNDLLTKVITVGDQQCDNILKKALAVGTKEALRIDVHETDLKSPNDISTLLYNSIKEDKSIDLILCGRQSDIHNYGQTGQILASKLGWPCFTNVYEIEYIENVYHLSRLSNNNEEKIIVKGPILITVIQTENKYLRMATLRNMLLAKTNEIEIISNETARGYLRKNNVKQHFQKLTIDKQIKQCQFITAQDDVDEFTQLNKIISKLKGET